MESISESDSHPPSDCKDIPQTKIGNKYVKSTDIKNLKTVNLEQKLKSTTENIDVSKSKEALDVLTISQDNLETSVVNVGVAPDQDSAIERKSSSPENDEGEKKVKIYFFKFLNLLLQELNAEYDICFDRYKDFFMIFKHFQIFISNFICSVSYM